MVVCPNSIPLSDIIPGILVLGSAITITVLAWYQSIKPRGLMPKGFKNSNRYLEIFK
jgi:hypothetical protein